MALTFSERLNRAMEVGHLTVADAARLFDRERRTVSDWVNNGREPTGPRAAEAYERLTDLEAAVRARRGFPIPVRLSKRNRAQYVRFLGEGNLERARILAKDAAA